MRLHIRYQDGAGTITEREISDLRKETDNTVDAFCHTRNERRSFNLDRIIRSMSVDTGELLNPYQLVPQMRDPESLDSLTWKVRQAIKAMKSQMTSDVAIDALLMAVWRRKPKQEVMIHSDQGSQYSSSDWRSFLKANNLIASMSRRGNCHDNAVAESFFQLLKRERIKRKIYITREDARGDVFDYIEMFYNAKRRHGFNNQLSPVEFEKRYAASLESV